MLPSDLLHVMSCLRDVHCKTRVDGFASNCSGDILHESYRKVFTHAFAVAQYHNPGKLACLATAPEEMLLKEIQLLQNFNFRVMNSNPIAEEREGEEFCMIERVMLERALEEKRRLDESLIKEIRKRIMDLVTKNKLLLLELHLLMLGTSMPWVRTGEKAFDKHDQPGMFRRILDWNGVIELRIRQAALAHFLQVFSPPPPHNPQTDLYYLT
jgi:hypothetical protein